jgi:Flp pilus assembly pilin Flp
MTFVKNKIQQEMEMRIGKQLVALISDERGGEVVEYAVVGGLMVIAAIGVIGKLGAKILTDWKSLKKGV